MKYLLPALALFACSPFVSETPASAHEFAAATVKIDHPWARPTVTTRQPAAVFFHLENTGDADDRLVSAEIDPSIATGAELHTTLNDEGTFRMRPLTTGIVVPAGSEVAVQPGGHHLMLFNLTAPLELGQRFPVVLVFEKAGRVEVEVVVETPVDADSAPVEAANHDGHGS
ncbi:MAG: copper chaperone PCu(A)C [Hyphomonadaceae bacterium]